MSYETLSDDDFVALWHDEPYRKSVRALGKLEFDQASTRYRNIMGRISPDERPADRPEAVSFRFRSHSEMYPSRKPAEWLIRNVLPRYGVALLFGGDGTGKSFLAIDMALSLVTGTKWFGYRTKCYGDILYVVAEGRIEDRIEAWLAEHGKSRE